MKVPGRGFRHRTRNGARGWSATSDLRRANAILRSASGYFAPELDPPTQLMVEYINAHEDEFGVEPICGELPIAPSTY